MICQLGDDLLLQILIRLPDPGFACRCKSVCKRWSSLISSLCFNRRFVYHHQSINQLPMPEDPNELQSTVWSFLQRIPIRYVRVPPMPPFRYVRDAPLRVLDCFRDLLLCGFWDIYGDNNELGRSYLVCNLFTKQWIALPLAPKKPVGYKEDVGRLVCEPCDPKKFDLGDDKAFVYSSEYRFKVVCYYQHMQSTKLDVFCSESGGWTQEAIVLSGYLRCGNKSVVSCNGELFWSHHKIKELEVGRINRLVAAFNPFRRDIRPTAIDVSAFAAKPWWVISVSQGALHVIAFEDNAVPVRRLSVWRLEVDRKSWRKLCEGLLNEKTSRCGNYEVESCSHQLCLHPYKPEVVLFNWRAGEKTNAILSWDLHREEVELFAELEGGPAVSRFMVFQPRVHCWPTPIPRYEELRGMYDGSYNFCAQSANKAAVTPSLLPSIMR
ncbi:unnamed protein product [Linum trigynum]|uniref:F-box domain-containing protein n=1 Tax=Linum trigynum TaxID=586398 RepID=A0AAV2GGY8_9ROSI